MVAGPPKDAAPPGSTSYSAVSTDVSGSSASLPVSTLPLQPPMAPEGIHSAGQNQSSRERGPERSDRRSGKQKGKKVVSGLSATPELRSESD